MRPRTAKKIVSRVMSGKVTAASYSISDVRQAFADTGYTLTEAHLAPWRLAADQKAEARADQAANHGKDKAKKADNIAARAKRKNVKPTDARDKAIKAAVKLTSKVAAEDAPGPDLTSMSDSKLKALCKSRGLSGYSKLKKPGLIKMLTDDGL